MCLEKKLSSIVIENANEILLSNVILLSVIISVARYSFACEDALVYILNNLSPPLPLPRFLTLNAKAKGRRKKSAF